MAADNDDRRRRILDAAARLLMRYGYDKTTMHDIAQEAGISKGGVYLAFDSKEDLFHALIMDESLRTVEQMLARIEQDPEGGTFHSLFAWGMIVLAENPLLKAVITRDKTMLGDFIRTIAKSPQFADVRPFTEQFIIALQEAGVVRRDLSPQMVVYLLSVVRYGFIRVDEILAQDAIPSLDDISAALPDFIDRALAPPEGVNREAGKRIIAVYMAHIKQMIEARKANENAQRNSDTHPKPDEGL